MAVTRRVVRAPVEDVWAVLCDGWLYPLWVVGAARVRDVDDGWPTPGTRIHHSFGLWPALLDDTTEVREVLPHSRLVLKARGWPAGAAEVVLELSPHVEGTLVSLDEDAIEGAGSWVPSAIRQPLLHWRNTETLRRFAYLAEGRPDELRAGPTGRDEEGQR